MDEVVKKKDTFKEKIKSFYKDIFSSSKKTIIYTGLLLASLLTIYFLAILIINDNFYNNFSDDSLQYYPFMVDFIRDIKTGNFSLFQFENYLGASFFSDTYYLPLDAFTLVILILSYIMPTEIVMSIVELIKMVMGSVILMVYLKNKNTKPTILHMIGLMYFASTGMACFSAFPSFTSLMFYLPLSILVIDSFINRKRWYLVPLFAFSVVLYNFYLAYTVFAFMAFAGIVVILEAKEGFVRFIKDEVLLVILIIFGLLMGMGIFLPSFMYITKSTTRSVASSDSLTSSLLMFKEYLELILSLFKDTFDYIVLMFKESKGFFNYSYDKTFLTFKSLIDKFSKTHLNGENTVNALLFNVEEYFRIMNTTYAPVFPTSFYGFQGSYFIEHISLYITGFGLLTSSFIFTLKGRIPRIYKYSIIGLIIFMSFPVFSYIFSGDLEVLYTRWINTLSIPLLIISAYVLNTVGFESFKFKKVIIPSVLVSYFGLFSSYHIFDKLDSIMKDNNFSDFLIDISNVLFYSVIILFILLCVYLIFIEKFKTKKNKILFSIPFISVLLTIFTYLLVKFINIISLTWQNSIKSNPLYDFDMMMILEYLALLTVFIIVIELFALLKGKKKLLIGLIACEIILGSALSLGTPVMISGKETTFRNTRNVEKFLNSYIDSSDMGRIYIDSTIEGCISNNINKTIGYSSNADIFHSFINSSTDGIVELLFNRKIEGQASKKSLNTYSYYLAKLLGYKYYLVSKDTDVSMIDSNIYTLISNASDPYNLFEFNDYESVLIYDSYIDSETYYNKTSSLDTLSKAKVLLENLIIDNKSDLEGILDYIEEPNFTNISDSYTYSLKRTMSASNKSIEIIDNVEYYKYSFLNDDSINTRSYAINIYSSINNVSRLIDESNIYLLLEDGSKVIPEVKSLNGSKLHIPIYGDSENKKAVALYVLKDNTEQNIPSLSYSIEAIFPNTNEISLYEQYESVESGLSAYYRFKVNSTFKSNVIISLYNSINAIDTLSLVVENEKGELKVISKDTYLNGYIKYIYVKKSNSSMALNNPPTLKFTTYEKEESISNKDYTDINITKSHESIILNYNRVSGSGYDVIMIPYAYSEEWKVISGNIKDVISVNGGFIGLVVDRSVEANHIILKFSPRGMALGNEISLIFISLYIPLLVNSIINKKKRGIKLCKL